MANVIVAVGRGLVQRAQLHVLPGQTLHAGREQARAVLRLGRVLSAAAAEVVVVVVERVLCKRRRTVVVEQVQVRQVSVTGRAAAVTPWLGAAQRDRRTSAQRRRHVSSERGQRGE